MLGCTTAPLCTRHAQPHHAFVGTTILKTVKIMSVARAEVQNVESGCAPRHDSAVTQCARVRGWRASPTPKVHAHVERIKAQRDANSGRRHRCELFHVKRVDEGLNAVSRDCHLIGHDALFALRSPQCYNLSDATLRTSESPSAARRSRKAAHELRIVSKKFDAINAR